MSLSVQDYRRNLENCLVHSKNCFGDAAAIWRELADSYRRETREKTQRASNARR